MSITPIYAGLLTFVFLVLSLRVIGLRRITGIGFGDGGNRPLLRRQRVHGNFAEYVPLVLILMAFAELQNLPIWLIHAIGSFLLGGRLIHAFAVGHEPEFVAGRVVGMAMTFTALFFGALCNLAPKLISTFISAT